MEHHHEKPTGLEAYRPLVIVVGTALLAAAALNSAGYWFMHSFMGLFFCLFSMFKFFDLKGFADGFQTYDLIAKKSREYAYAYPVMELVIGLAYLSYTMPKLVYLFTVAWMAVSALGVFQNKDKGMSCACLGTALNVPLGTVSLIENLGMGAMALLMLLG